MDERVRVNLGYKRWREDALARVFQDADATIQAAFDKALYAGKRSLVEESRTFVHHQAKGYE